MEVNKAGGSRDVAFDLAGQHYILKLGCNELIEAAKALGFGDEDDKFMQTIDERLRSLRGIRTITHQALRVHQSVLTEEQVGEIVTQIGLARLGELIGQALVWMKTADDEPEAAGQ